MLAYGAISFFSNRYGRKPVILTIFCLFLASLVSLIAAQMTRGWVSVVLLVLWINLDAISGAQSLMLATNMYVIDLVHPQDR